MSEPSAASFFPLVIPAKAGIQGVRRDLRPWIPAFTLLHIHNSLIAMAPFLPPPPAGRSLLIGLRFEGGGGKKEAASFTKNYIAAMTA